MQNDIHINTFASKAFSVMLCHSGNALCPVTPSLMQTSSHVLYNTCHLANVLASASYKVKFHPDRPFPIFAASWPRVKQEGTRLGLAWLGLAWPGLPPTTAVATLLCEESLLDRGGSHLLVHHNSCRNSQSVLESGDSLMRCWFFGRVLIIFVLFILSTKAREATKR